jgi:predicted DNA-binding transcriptional regulator YafY
LDHPKRGREMKELKSTERLLRLITLFQTSRQRLTVNDLAERFGVTRRTIFRDLRKMSELEIPVTYDPFEGHGIMKDYNIPPLMFSTRELATLIVGLNFVKAQVDRTLCDDAHGVEGKIRHVLPADLGVFMDSLIDKTVVDPFLHFGLEKQDGGHWYEISSAIALQKRIEFRYTDAGGREQGRVVDPYMIVFYKDHWNMIGFSHERKEIRNFRLNRIHKLIIRDDVFKTPEAINAEALLFRNARPKAKVVVEVEPQDDRRFRANLPTKIFRTNENLPELIRHEFYFDNLDFLNQWLFQFGENVRVVAPKKLRELRKETLREMLKALG